MNVNKAQKEIFNAMLSGERCGKYEIDEKSVFIAPDGYRGFVIPYSQVQINLAKIPEMKNLDIQSVVRDDNLCELTNELIITKYPKRYARKLKRGNERIYFNEKFMSCFQNPKFYNAHPYGMIVVTEDISATRENEIVGVILPMRISDEL